MIDPFDLWNSFQSAVNTFQGGWYRPQTDFIQRCNDLSKKFWVDWTDEADKSQKAKDNLQPFFKSKNFIVSNEGVYGTFKTCKDYGRFAAARIILHDGKCQPDYKVDGGKTEGGKSDGIEFKSQEEITEEYYDSIEQVDIMLVDNIKWGAMNAHKTKKPTFEKPKMRQINGGFEVAPRKVSVVVLDYYREPKPATFLYTKAPGDVQTGAGDQIIYDRNSAPLEWPFSVRDEFLIGLGKSYGVFTRDQFVTQVNMQKT